MESLQLSSWTQFVYYIFTTQRDTIAIQWNTLCHMFGNSTVHTAQEHQTCCGKKAKTRQTKKVDKAGGYNVTLNSTMPVNALSTTNTGYGKQNEWNPKIKLRSNVRGRIEALTLIFHCFWLGNILPELVLFELEWRRHFSLTVTLATQTEVGVCFLESGPDNWVATNRAGMAAMAYPVPRF